jgi:hypothetical protein
MPGRHVVFQSCFKDGEESLAMLALYHISSVNCLNIGRVY